MPAPVTIQFQTVGTAELKSAFDMAEARLKKLGQLEAKSARMSKQNAFAANDNASVRSARDQARAMQEVAKWRKLSHDADLKQAKVESQRAKNARVGLQAEKDKLAIQRQQLALHDREARVVERNARQATSTARRQASAMSREHRALAATQRARVGQMSGIVGRAGRSTLGTITGVAGGLGITSAGFMAADAIQQNIALEQQAAQLVNATRGETGKAKRSPGQLVGIAQSQAVKWGVSAEDVMAGMQTVSARAGGGAGLDKMIQDMDFLVELSAAYGTSMQDVGGIVAASLEAGIQPGKEMRDVMTNIIAQGKAGSVEFADLASELPKLMGAARQYNLTPAQMVSRMVALSQIAVKQRVSPEEARTSVIDVTRDIMMKSQYLEKSGINLVDSSGKARDPFELLADIIDMSETKGLIVPGATGRGKGDRKKGVLGMSKIFTGTSLAIMTGLMDTYRQGDPKTGKNGREGIMSALGAFDTAGLAQGEFAAASRTVQGTTANQATKAMQQFYAEMGKLTPQIAQLLPPLTQLAQGLAKAAVWAAKNPFAAVGGLLAANLTKEIVTAGIGESIKNVLTSQVAGSGVQQTLGSVSGGAVSASAGLRSFAGVLGVVGSALAGFAAGKAIHDVIHGSAQASGDVTAKSAGDLVNKAKLSIEGVRSSQVSPAAANKMASELEAQAAKVRAVKEKGASIWGNITTAGGAQTEATALAHVDPTELEAMAKALRGATFEAGQRNLQEFLGSIDAAKKGLDGLADAAPKPNILNPNSGARGGHVFAPSGAAGGIAD